MKDFAAKKEKYFSEFADLIEATFLKMKYGVANCKTQKDPDLITMRYELATWQSCCDFSTLSEIRSNSKRWLPINLSCEDSYCNVTIISGPEGKSFHITPPQTVWTLVHDLSFMPNVTTTDENGQEILGTVVYVSDTLITVTFSQPVSGWAYLS
jgi:hypothetical protein